MLGTKKRYKVVASYYCGDDVGEGFHQWQTDDQHIVCDSVVVSETGDLLFYSRGDGEPLRLVAAFRNSYWDSFIEVDKPTGRK